MQRLYHNVKNDVPFDRRNVSLEQPKRISILANSLNLSKHESEPTLPETEIDFDRLEVKYLY